MEKRRKQSKPTDEEFSSFCEYVAKAPFLTYDRVDCHARRTMIFGDVGSSLATAKTPIAFSFSRIPMIVFNTTVA